MARVPSRVAAKPSTVDEPVAIDPRAPTDATLDAIAGQTDEGQRAPHRRVHRMDNATGKLGYLCNAPPDRVNEQWLTETFGGGEYVSELYAPRQDGSFGYIKGERKEYIIDKSIPFKGPLQARVEGPGARPAREEDEDYNAIFKNSMLGMIREQNDTRQTGMTLLTGMLNQMQQNQQTFMTMMASMLKQPAADANGGQMALLMPIILALVGKQQDPVALATQLMEHMKPESSLRDTLAVVRELKEAGGMFESDGNGTRRGTDWGGVIEKGLETGLDLLRKEQERTPPPPPPRAFPTRPPAPRQALPASAPDGAPGAASGNPPPEAAPVREETQDEWSPLEGDIMRLTGFAQTNADTDDVAGLLMMFAPAERKASLREMLVHDDLGERMCVRFPESIGRYPSWLDDFLDALRERFGLIDPVDGDDHDELPPAPGDGPV
jgi:hypothetical protein